MSLPTIRPRPTTMLSRRWDPYSELEGLYEQMNQLMSTVTGDIPVAIPVDIEETDNAFLIEIDLPGVKREDIEVEVRERQLRVTGEIKERERTGILRRHNRPVGRFDYAVSVPGEIDPERIEASLAHGVLTVELGKAASSRPRHVEIKG